MSNQLPDKPNTLHEIKAYNGNGLVGVKRVEIEIPKKFMKRTRFLNKLRKKYKQEFADQFSIHRSKLTVLFFYNH